MTRRKLMIAALVLGFGPLTLSARADDKAAANARARVQAARKVYEGMLKRRQADPSSAAQDFEKLYLWSRRWMEAQRELSAKKEDRVAAAEGHLDRMRKLESVVKRLHAQGTVAEADAAAAEFYRLEAEKWLAEAKGK